MINNKIKESYEEGVYLWGNYLSVVCQNWILCTMDDKFKKKYGDDIYYLVTVPYISGYYGFRNYE